MIVDPNVSDLKTIALVADQSLSAHLKNISIKSLQRNWLKALLVGHHNLTMAPSIFKMNVMEIDETSESL